MSVRHLVVPSLVVATALVAGAAPAAATSRATCLVRVPVQAAADGSFSGGAHDGSSCAGTLAGATLAARAASATVAGRLRPGPTRCAPTIEDGRLVLTVPRLLNFAGATDTTLKAAWALDVPASAGPVSGAGTVDGEGIALTGTLRYVAASGAGCSGGGFAPGAVEFALGVVDGPAPAEQPTGTVNDDGDAGDPGERTRPDRKAKPKRRCARKGKAKNRRAGERRCRRAARKRR